MSNGPFTDGTSTTSTDGTSDTGGATSTADTFKPITSQDEFDAALGPRLARERAKFGDYDELKAKAEKLDEIEESQKDELTKANDRAKAAEAEVEKLPALVADALRTHLKTIHEISDEDAELFLTATDPDLLLKQVDRLMGRAEDALTGGNRVSREGHNRTPKAPDERREFLASITGQG